MVLVKSLLAHTPPTTTAPTLQHLQAAFDMYESTRIPRTAGLVHAARLQGARRVCAGEACKERDEFVHNMYSNEVEERKKLDELYIVDFWR